MKSRQATEGDPLGAAVRARTAYILVRTPFPILELKSHTMSIVTQSTYTSGAEVTVVSSRCSETRGSWCSRCRWFRVRWINDLGDDEPTLQASTQPALSLATRRCENP
jgi:hypothetical protein